MAETQYFLTNFYQFLKISPEELEGKASLLNEVARTYSWTGLAILGVEGINMSLVTESQEALDFAKEWLRSQFGDIYFKNFLSEVKPFRRFVVKTRSEIVTTGTSHQLQEMAENHHLSPEEWDKVMESGEAVVVDTRNWYETQMGKFKGALVPDIDQFSEFPNYFQEQGIQKDKKILIYCTGGIRCEKGILELQAQGYKNVYQLQGGIFEYLREKPHSQFEGECFVFDRRVAVDQNLAPSKKFGLCPHCGQPSQTPVVCKDCGVEKLVCESCLETHESLHTCSKKCAHEYRRKHGQLAEKPKVSSRKFTKSASVGLG